MATRYQCRPPAQPAGPDGATGGPDGAAGGARRLVGVAGTVTTLAGLDLGLRVYDPERIHLASLSLESVRGLVARLGAMTTAERAALPCLVMYGLE